MTRRWEAMAAKEVNGKNYWTKLGVMFENRSGNGFTVSLDAIPAPVDGAYKFSFFEPKDNSDRSNSNNGGGYQNNSSNSGGYSSGRPGSNRGQSQNDDMGDDIPF